MSDLPAEALSLEESNETPEPQPAPPPEPQAATPPPNADDAEPEGVVVNPSGEKLVPLSALAAARQATRDAKAEAAALRPKADIADKVYHEWQAVQPLIQRAQQAAQSSPPPAAKGPLSESEAVDYAKDLDLFKPDGTPDVDRAQRLAGRQEALAQRSAAMMVQPFAQQTAHSQSQANLSQAISWSEKQKTGIDRGIMERVWAIVPPEQSARPDVAGILYRVALAESVMAGNYKAPSTPPPPLVDTASLGTRDAVKTSLNSIDQAFRQAADIPEKRFTETREKYQPGRSNSLE